FKLLRVPSNRLGICFSKNVTEIFLIEVLLCLVLKARSFMMAVAQRNACSHLNDVLQMNIQLMSFYGWTCFAVYTAG
ncbi:hypothetical protein KI387_014955, partial [Taxus chinensis]